MEPVEVVAKFDPNGEITPRSFNWKGADYRVVSVGRRWEDSGSQHILVMVPDERVFELVFQPASGVWSLRRWDAAGSVA
ncbi:MAG: hypothetical protein ACWGO1_04665 [Anaerolineales bacterium]